MLRIIHTADWHLGRQLFGRRRDEEFAAFLRYLAELVAKEADVLLISGDVFDSTMPPTSAQRQYYEFLLEVARSPCRHVVITGGNHDSASFLQAPREVLRLLNVHVVGAVSESLADEVITLHDAQGMPELIVCAVPFLRERDMRSADSGASALDKTARYVEGIRAHYAAVAELAQARSDALGGVAVVGMGHLFTTGAMRVQDDGVRDLYVGSLAQVGAEVFPAVMRYVALGHLHVPQNVAGMAHIQYSGSPLAMGFGEAGQTKRVCKIIFDGDAMHLDEIVLPVWRELKQIKGDMQSITQQIQALEPVPMWLEVIYQGQALHPQLRQEVQALVKDLPFEVLRVQNQALRSQRLNTADKPVALQDWQPQQVFTNLLMQQALPEEQTQQLQSAFAEILQNLYEREEHAD